jgi:hypothetical protein
MLAVLNFKLRKGEDEMERRDRVKKKFAYGGSEGLDCIRLAGY